MDFQTVCKRSTLSAETVRFYVNEGLVQPLYTASHLPDDAEYAEEDLSRLEAVANLNRLQLPLPEMKRFFTSTAEAARVMLDHHARLSESTKLNQQRLEILDGLDLANFTHMTALTEMLAQQSIALPLTNPERQQVDPHVRVEAVRRLQNELDDLAYELTAQGMRNRRQFLMILVLLFLLLLSLGWIIGPYFL